MTVGQSVCRLAAGDRVTDLSDWTHATVLYGGEYEHPFRAERVVSLQYDDGRRRDYIPVGWLQ